MNSGYEYREVVGAGAAGATLLDHLARHYRHSTRDEWGARIEAGRVLLDGEAAQGSVLLRAGHSIVWRRPPWNEPEAPLSWALLYRDDDLLGVAKPAGLPTLPGGGFLENTLLALVRRRYPEAAPVHRLDRGTSGVVLFARHRRAAARLARDFREGRIEKQYIACVDGVPESDRFIVETAIGRVMHPILGAVFAAVRGGGSGGRPARTRVAVRRRTGATTLVEAWPETGRPHQVRIHLAATGLPLAGEPLYAAGGVVKPDASAAGGSGFLLHAARIGFDHPADRRRIAIECRPPAWAEAGLTSARPAAL